jgi:hypothetical protein
MELMTVIVSLLKDLGILDDRFEDNLGLQGGRSSIAVRYYWPLQGAMRGLV